MPTYEYVCSSCGNAWEEIQKITEPAIELCPACQKATAKRQISGGTFILKGGGWYSDLYSSPKAAPSKDDSSKSGDSGKSDKSDKSESKDAKTETKSDGETKKSEPKKESSAPAAPAGGSSGSSSPAKAAAE